MNIISRTLLALVMLFAINVNAQTTKKAVPTKTATPVKKTVAKKPVAQQNSAAKAAAIAKAKEDSVIAVNEKAMQIARQIIREDSIKKAQAAEVLAADAKLKQEQLQADEQLKKPAKTTKEKAKKDEAAKVKAEKKGKEKVKKEQVAREKPEKKAKEPVKKVPDELRPVSKPQEASTDAKALIGLRALGIGSFLVGKDVTSEYKPFIGYGGGLVANFGLGKHLSFQPEVLYAQEGFVVKTEVLAVKYNVSVAANVVQVPLLLKYSFGAYNKGFFVNVGPYGNYLINTVTVNKLSGAEKVTTKPDKTTLEYGVAGGVGVAVPIGRGRLLVEARGTYYLGTNQKEDEPSGAKIVTGALSIGYLFPIGH